MRMSDSCRGVDARRIGSPHAGQTIGWLGDQYKDPLVGNGAATPGIFRKRIKRRVLLLGTGLRLSEEEHTTKAAIKTEKPHEGETSAECN